MVRLICYSLTFKCWRSTAVVHLVSLSFHLLTEIAFLMKLVYKSGAKIYDITLINHLPQHSLSIYLRLYSKSIGNNVSSFIALPQSVLFEAIDALFYTFTETTDKGSWVNKTGCSLQNSHHNLSANQMPRQK